MQSPRSASLPIPLLLLLAGCNPEICFLDPADFAQFELVCDVEGEVYQLPVFAIASTCPGLEVGGSDDFSLSILVEMPPDFSALLSSPGAEGPTLDRFEAVVGISGASPLLATMTSEDVPQPVDVNPGQSSFIHTSPMSIHVTHDGSSPEVRFSLQALAFQLTNVADFGTLVVAAPTPDPTAAVRCALPEDDTTSLSFAVP